MIQRFLFDRVDAKAAGAAIGDELDFIVEALAYVTQPALPLAKMAVAWAQVALQAPIVEAMPVACFDYALCTV